MDQNAPGAGTMQAILYALARQMGSRSFFSEATAEKHPVVVELEALAFRQHRAVACAISVLWDEFVASHGGLAGLKSRTPTEQAHYVNSLKRAAWQVRQSGEAGQLHYALAPTLMALYAEALVSTAPSEQDREIAAITADLVNRGNLIRKSARRVEEGGLQAA